MEVPMLYIESPTFRDSVQVSKKLGEGKFSVYQVHSPRNKENYALKLFPKNTFGTAQYRKERLVSNLNHPNVIQHIASSSNHPKFYTLVTEFAKNGDFFEIVIGGLLSDEALVRTYFHQLINGLEHIHSQGVAHLDLKLENLMMSSDFLLKIIDFDQSQPIKDKTMTSGGTSGYRAPEVRRGATKNLAAVDIYSAGIILFAFLAREFPFLEVEDPENQDIRCCSTFHYNNDLYWAKKSRKMGDKVFFSDEFIELVNGMLHHDPIQRFKIQDIKNSKWFRGPVLSIDKLRAEMQARCSGALSKRKAK